MDNITVKVVEILKSFDYEIEKKDSEIIEFYTNKIKSEIMYECAIEDIPEALEYIIAEMVCGEFISQKRLLSNDIDINLDMAIKSIQVGDTTTTFVEGVSDSQKLDAIVKKLMHEDLDLSPYAKMRW